MNNIFCNSIVKRDMEEIYESNISWDILNNCTIFVTGATGMLASYITFFLIYLVKFKNVNLRIIMHVRSIKKAEEIFGNLIISEDIRIVTGSILDKIIIDDQIDYIIHAASLASPQFYTTCPIAVAEPNAIGTYHLLKLAEEKECKGFLLFSTGDIYGRIIGKHEVYEDTEGYVDPLSIHSCYNESKRMAETWCRIFAFEKKVPCKIARIWHTYSPNMDIINDPRVFSSLVKCAIQNRDIEILSSGKQTRTFCYITDAIVGFFLILLKGNNGEAYNICNTDECWSINEIAEIVKEASQNKNIRIIHSKRSKEDKYIENMTYGDIIPINSKLKNLGWVCKVDCESGFTRVINKIWEDKHTGGDK